MSDKKINGELFQSMVIEGALSILEKKEQANELNVFPVPDGDTGINMALTMSAAKDALSQLHTPTLCKSVETTSSALLRGARGNSGVILSLLFRGMAKRLKDLTEADGRDFALALREGVETAYKAVMNPTEGTILTVARVASEKCAEAFSTCDSPAKLWEIACVEGEITLDQTPDMNYILNIQ